jgi:vacuolar protein sorting-associated protein 13A/C
MSINVGLPPADVGTKEDQAMRVGLDISKASFLFSKRQYAQILSTLDLNIGDPDLCLRESSAESVFEGIPSESDSTGFVAGLTHAGVAMVDNPGRIYVDVHIIALSLELCAASDEEPIVRLAAMEADISLKMLPDEDKMTCQVSLRDLICDDRRLKAIGRQYRSLIYQDDQKAAGATQQTTQNLFLVSYEANQNGSSTVDLNIGSPRLVLIPDVVSEVLVFLDVPRQQSKPQQAKTSPEHENSSQREVVEVEASQSQEAFEAAFVLKSEKADTLEFATLSLAVKTAQCSIILVDLGSDSLLPAKRSPLSSATVSSVAETIVLSGTFSANVSLDSSSQTGELMNVQAQIHGDELEAYTAFGRDLNSPLQILDPVNFSVYFTSKTVDDTGAIARSVDLRAAALTPLDISLSMRNVALVNAILSSISECFDDGNENQVIEHDRFLSQQETVRIENLASALSTEDPNPSFHSHDSSGIADPSTLSVTGHGDTADVSSVISIKLTMPETKVTLINDLQGLDEALLRITIRNLVAGGQARVGERLGVGSSQFTGFDLNVHTSVLADYFDASSNDWEVLLLRPWEATLKAGRSANLKSQPFRPSTAIDVESFPCHMSFSEQFLMSLASANRMWSVYSTATSSVLDSVGPTSEVGELSNQKRKSMAATAARTFITSLPYALDNHSGVPVGFLVHGELADLRTCETGSIEYFQFEPPPGNGSGGKRLYGRDVAFAKSISVFVGDSAIELTNLDGKLGFPTRAHELQTGQVFMTQIVKEGKTIVSRRGRSRGEGSSGHGPPSQSLVF